MSIKTVIRCDGDHIEDYGTWSDPEVSARSKGKAIQKALEQFWQIDDTGEWCPECRPVWEPDLRAEWIEQRRQEAEATAEHLRRWDEWHRAVKEHLAVIVCPLCGAGANEPCMTSTGKLAPNAHTVRRYAAQKAAGGTP